MTMANLRSIAFMLVISAVGNVAHSTVRHVSTKSGLVLKPGEIYTTGVESVKPVEFGWTAVQAKPCATNCVEMTQVGSRFGFATGLGASKTYQPADGKVEVQFKNISEQPVTIDVYQVVRICNAESCQFLDNTKKGHTLVFRVREFRSITTSNDESYSVISGVAESGRSFRFYAVWFTDDKTFMNLEKGCTTWIKRYFDNRTPNEQYRPYVIAGQNVGDQNKIVLRSIDTCTAHANHFGVLSEDEVFK